MSFIQLALLAGFDAHLSHDEFVEFGADRGDAQLVQDFIAPTAP